MTTWMISGNLILYLTIVYLIAFLLIIEMDKGTTNWCTLQKDVLEEISNRLNTRIDVLRLRAVCASWRSVVPFPLKTHIPEMPLKLPFPIAFNNFADHSINCGHFDLKESTIYFIEPLTKITNAWNTTKSWLIRAEDVEFGKLCLRHPLSRFPLVGLRGEMFNLFDYRVVEVSKAYNLEFVSASNSPTTTFNEQKTTHLKQIAVSPKNEGDFAIMAIGIHGTLGLWKMGYNRWSKIEISHKEFHFNDIAYHNGRFYAVDNEGMTIAIDSSFLKVSKVTSPMRSFDGNQHGGQRLVESLGKLLMVVMFLENEIGEYDHVYSIRFVVYTLNEEKSKWDLGGDLKERALFLGDDCSFSVSARDFAGCKRNSVYFVYDMFEDDDGNGYQGKAFGLFDFEDETSQALPTVTCYSKIFWPPPTWLKRRAS